MSGIFCLNPGCLDDVLALVRQTIKEVYPACYPAPVTEFFIAHHCREAVLKDIGRGMVYGLLRDGALAATVTIDGYNINRMFVRPRYQGQGLGGAMLAFAEGEIARGGHAFAQLAASVPGYPFYFARGYRTEYCGDIKTKDGCLLVYQVMRKVLPVV